MNKSDWVGSSCRAALICLAMAARGAESLAAEPATAPHGAMPMQAQQQRLDQLITGLSTPPPGIDPVAWATIYVPADNPTDAGPHRPRPQAVFRYAPVEGRHGVLRHLPRREPRLHRPAQRLGRDRRSSRQALRTDDHERGSSPKHVLGRSRADARRNRPSCRFSIPSRWDIPTRASAVAAVDADPAYQGSFQKAYGRAPNYEDVGRAIASFERTLIFLDAPFDKFVARRRQRHLARRAARPGVVQRQGALRQLPHDQLLQSARHRQPVPQHRRLGAHAELRGSSPQKALGRHQERHRRARARQAGAGNRPVGVGSLHRHPQRAATSAPSRPSSCATWASRRLTCTTARCGPCGTWWTTTTRAARPTPTSTAASSRWT